MSNIAKTLNCKNCGNMVWAFLESEFNFWKNKPIKELEAFEHEKMKDHYRVCLNQPIDNA